MSSTVNGFINDFHSLQGVTIKERRRHLYQLIHKHASALKDTPEDLNHLSANLQPGTCLEETFKVDLLIFFRRTSDLVQLLKAGNPSCIGKILKQDWLFSTYFNELPPAELVNGFLPLTSYAVRMKILTKLSHLLDPQKFDDIFDQVAERYGIFLASRFIAGCSVAKIWLVLKEYPVKLTSGQIISLYRKDPDLLSFYFGEVSGAIHDDSLAQLLKTIYVENRGLYNSLKKKHEFSLRFGRRATKKIVAGQREAIVRNPEQFRNLYFKAVVRKLGKDSVAMLTNLLPADIEQIHEVNWLLQDIPKRYHYGLFFNVIQRHYKVDFLENPKLIDERFLKLVPNETERLGYARALVNSGDDQYLKYLQTAESIPLIKDKINLTSDINDRGRLIKNLLETCQINNDLSSLTQVMKYFNFRHKNDDLSVHLRFINHIELLFGFRNFTEEMWNTLNDLLLIHMLKYDHTDSSYKKVQNLPLLKYNLGITTFQKLSYLNFLHLKGMDISDLLTDYFREHGVHGLPTWGEFSVPFEKEILRFAVQYGAGDFDNLESKVDYNCFMIDKLKSWNQHYVEDKVNFYEYPHLVDAFNYAVNNNQYDSYMHTISEELRKHIFTTIANPYKEPYLEVYFRRFSVFYTAGDFVWFLTHEPSIILGNFPEVFKEIVRISLEERKVWYVLRKMSHLGIDEKMVSLALSKLNDESCEDYKPKLVVCLSLLMKAIDYVKFADANKPSSRKLDLGNETQVRLYKTQCAIATNFKNIPDYTTLDSLLNYCMGDYFHYGMTSLYAILYRTPETHLGKYFEYLSTKAVSVRKHALFLTCELTTASKVDEIINSLRGKPDVQSLQKVMLVTTLKYFIKNPEDRFFELLKSNMQFISRTDDESLRIITQDNMNRIPKRYKAAYIEHVWKTVEALIDIWKKQLELKSILIPTMVHIVSKELPLDFALDIIRKHFQTDKSVPGVDNFIFNLIAYHDSSREIFQDVFRILEPKDHNTALAFFDLGYERAFSAPNFACFAPFVEFYRGKIRVLEDFKQYLDLFILQMIIDTPRTDLGLFAQTINVFVHHLNSTYGPYVIEIFAKELKNAFSNLMRKFSVFSLCQKLMSDVPSVEIAVLVLHVLHAPSDKKPAFEIFCDILRQLKEIEHSAVKILMYHKFKCTLEKLQMNMEIESED